MNQKFRNTKNTIREYLRTAYSDDKLALLLDYTRAGKLRWNSCCCLSGLALLSEGITPLRSSRDHSHGWMFHSDGNGACMDSPASDAYRILARSDAKRRRILIPMILVEIKRRAYANKLDTSLLRKTTAPSLPHDGLPVLPPDSPSRHSVR